MSIENFPSVLQPIIQTGWLEHAFQSPLQSKLGYRAIADREAFAVNVGETITKTRTGLLSTATTPINSQAVSPLAGAAAQLDNGMTPDQYGVEQFTVGLNQYGKTLNLNVVTQRVGIQNRFAQNAKVLGENAQRTMDELCRNALFGGYLSGNTYVTVASTTTSVNVDDVRGFLTTYVNGVPTPLGGGNNLSVTIGATVYTVVAAVADGTNTSKSFQGKSGVLTLSAAVSSSDGAVGSPVVSAIAPTIIRPNGRATQAALTASDMLTMSAILDAKASLDANAVPSIDGFYNVYLDPVSARQLFADPDFKQLFQGATSENEVYKQGAVESPFLGIRFLRTTNAPIQAWTPVTGKMVRRPVICGQGALVEADFAQPEPEGTVGGSLVSEVDGVTMVTRPPLDRLQQEIAQTWSWIGGFVAPSDMTSNPNTISTATNAAYKRAVVIEHIG